MGIINKIAKRFIYCFTEKPTHYVHVDDPKTLQEYRQVQYNNWCKTKGVYNGSYLPVNPSTLTRKGWRETTSSKNKTGFHRQFQRKSSGQIVDYHSEKQMSNGKTADEHYHWWEAYSLEDKPKMPKCTQYRDRFGNICRKRTPESHLAPLDKKYNYK